jgi:hypothetical protein
MKRIFFFIFSMALLTLFSCSYSKGVKKDLSTGLSASYNGFGIDDIYLTDVEGNRLGSNKITMGSKIAIFATGVDHFSVKEGKVFPGCRIILTDKNKKEILNLPDAFSDMVTGTPEAEAKTLKASLNTGNPMEVGETYHLSVRFFDKNKAENEIVADVDILMKE